MSKLDLKLFSLMALAVFTIALPALGQQVSLTGAGATFPYPMYSKWFDDYHKLHPEIQINYQSFGSGVVLLMLVLVVNIVAKLILGRGHHGG